MKVRFHAGAKADLEAAQDWYEAERRGLGDKLTAEVDYGLGLILEHPLAWPKWPDAPYGGTIRRFLLVRFPYALAYVSTADRIIVLAVAHTRRRPHWFHRYKSIL